MKLNKNFKNLLPIAAFALSLTATSCVSDLDVDPTIDKNTDITFNQDANFRKIYANMALTGQQGPAGNGDIADIDEGTSDFFRQLWNMNELPTDEAICSWGDAGIPEYNYGTWDASHGMVTCEYYRLYMGISLCNEFLTKTEELTDDHTKTERAEARFMRAMYYYYATDLFGNVPFMTVVSEELAPQKSRAEICKFIEDELLDCVKDMKAPGTNTYGRADQAAAWLLLARLYLNSEVYTGTARWEDAAIYAKKVMDSSYDLSPSYKNLFMGDNNSNGAQIEIILPILQDGIQTQNYGGSLFLIASTHKDDMPSTGTSENWAGNRARKQLIDKFFSGKAPNGDVDEMVSAAKDDRAMFFGKDRTLEIKKPSDFKQGFSCAKFTNLHADGSATHDSKFVDMDVPFMRAAEAWLTYAEAEKRLGHDSECKMAIDYLRNRAHKSTQPKYTLNEICDEWAREFYYEGRRRMDLIRFGKFGGDSDYTWEWKGGSQDGGTIEASRNVYGIPTKECVANSNIKQNPGYGD